MLRKIDCKNEKKKKKNNFILFLIIFVAKNLHQTNNAREDLGHSI